MKTQNCLVLSQYRVGSEYEDRVGRQYHFPNKYYSLMTLPDVEFVYYEPKQRGNGEYFGYGKIGAVTQDPSHFGRYFAEIVEYRTFSSPVPYQDEQGTYIEHDLSRMAQQAVRKIDEDLLRNICQKGGIDLSTLGTESENITNDERITNPFDPSSIKIDRDVQSIFQILRKIDFGEVQLNPDFQRNLVWDVVRRSRLIESVLLKIPLPAFYFDGTKDNKWLVVDGLQRLTSLQEFVLAKTLQLQDLEYLSHLEGKNFDGLPRNLQRQIEDTPLTLYVIRPDTPPHVKFTIFYRINTGGLVLTPQEIRNSLFVGAATQLLKRLVSTSQFQQAIESSLSDTRMDAQECIVRYLAFRIRGYRHYKKPDLNWFLSDCMKDINEMSEAQVELLGADFLEAMERARLVLGHFAFRKFNIETGRRGPINKALFESWSNVLQDFDRDALVMRKGHIIASLDAELRNNADYARFLSAGTGSVRAVTERFRMAHKIVEQSLT